jgi:hypothetical protein
MPSVEGVDDNVPPRGYGVYGRSDTSYGVHGYSANGSGVTGSSPVGVGVLGAHGNVPAEARAGVWGRSISFPGVNGWSVDNSGVSGSSDTFIGVYGISENGYGVASVSRNSYGVYAYSESGLAALLDGNVRITGGVDIRGPVTMTSDVNMYGPVTITGPLTKPGGSFKIDHPLDPANKYLSHSFVESPDRKNVYDGVVTLDDKGEAVIELPDWFGALNKDFRYQLTAIGAPGPNLYIAEEISDASTTTITTNYSRTRSNKNNNGSSRFKVAGGTSGMKVSWQVTGIRKDPWANAHRISVEEDKPAKERGYYIYPELYGQPEEKGIISQLLVPEIEKELLINK